ncbi:MAG: hypothetical protein ACXWQO_10105 [Bdellovibrionota bacterium]
MAKPFLSKNQKIVLEMLDEIERTRSGMRTIEELEEKLWRLLDGTDLSFPVTVASQVEELVQGLRRLRVENRAFANSDDVDEDRGTETLYNEVVGALSKLL